MTLFSERMGYKPVRSVMQIESMDDELRIGLWNVLEAIMWTRLGYHTSLNKTAQDRLLNQLCMAIWGSYFKKRLDTQPVRWDQVHSEFRRYFFDAAWHEVYSFLEFIRAHFAFGAIATKARDRFDAALNAVLERDLAGYRLVSGHMVPITTPEEIEAVEEATKLPASLKVVGQHLQAAIDKLSERPSGDYRNSIKESISAVEAMCSIIAGQSKADLDAALRVLEKRLALHPALKSAFGKLYGYTSDQDGIRQAFLEESTLTAEDAIFMLVTCWAFVNYLKALAARAGLTL
jgi:hypothetical protein